MNEKIKDILRTIYFLPGGIYNGTRLRLSGFSVGKNFRSTGRIAIFNHSGKSTIGNNVSIHSNWKANPIGSGERTILRVLKGGKLEIGNNVEMSFTAITCRKSVVIEDYAMLGGGVRIYDTDFHSINPHVRMRLAPKEPARSKPVRIGAFSFVGAGSFILKGSDIGFGSVIGAGSVVSGKIPDWQIWAGNPARYIRDVSEEERGEISKLYEMLEKNKSEV